MCRREVRGGHLDGRRHAVDHLLDLALEAGRLEERFELVVPVESGGDHVWVPVVEGCGDKLDVAEPALVRAVELCRGDLSRRWSRAHGATEKLRVLRWCRTFVTQGIACNAAGARMGSVCGAGRGSR
eukprot:2412244-Prymnesium_polylepis.1